MKIILFLLSLFTTIPSANMDSNRTNSNTSEVSLTPANVSGGRFVLLGSYNVDGLIFSQPLFIPAITTTTGIHDLVIITTLNNSVYAFDANRLGTTAIWSNLAFATPFTGYPVSESILYNGGLGCLSTPVADVPNLKLYVVCDSVVGSTPNWILRQLDLTTGATLQTTTISGQYPGTGDPNGGDPLSGPNLLFSANFTLQRAGLALANNTIYIAFGSVDDTRPSFHGWIMAYSTSSLTQTAIFCTSPNSFGAAPWMSGGAPAVDGSGNVYIVTGNGTYDGITAFGECVLKFSSSLSLSAVFVNPSQGSDTTVDADFASNRFLLIPGTTLGVGAGKDFSAYVLNLSGMTQAQTFKSNAAGTPGGGSGSYGMAFLNNVLYLPTTTGSIYAFSFSGGSFNTTPIATQTNTYGFPGTSQISGSINGTSNGILWVVTVLTSTKTVTKAGTLHALNPTTLSEYWNSSTSGHDNPGTMAKFTAPVIANGKVFLATMDSKVQVFGLLPTASIRGKAALRGTGAIR
jgi:hypothetical protein